MLYFLQLSVCSTKPHLSRHRNPSVTVKTGNHFGWLGHSPRLKRRFKNRVGIISGCVNGGNAVDIWHPLRDARRCRSLVHFRCLSSFTLETQLFSCVPHAMMNCCAGIPVPLFSTFTPRHGLLFQDACRLHVEKALSNQWPVDEMNDIYSCAGCENWRVLTMKHV